MTPHIGAASDGAMYNMATYAAQGVIDKLEGRMPKFVVNRDVLDHLKEV